MNESLRTALRKLRLSGLADTLEVRLAEAAGHNLSHAEFLELVLQDELLIRAQRQIQRRVKTATFRELKLLGDFNWSFNPSIQKKQLLDLAACHFIREARDVLLMGPPGVGKRDQAKDALDTRREHTSTAAVRWLERRETHHSACRV